jgi:hypothetical protein
MCGIAGVLLRDSGAIVNAAEITAMCDVITHRGPDDQGVYVSGSVGLGMRRLSIIDLAGGHQPMQTEDGRLPSSSTVKSTTIATFGAVSRKKAIDSEHRATPKPSFTRMPNGGRRV